MTRRIKARNTRWLRARAFARTLRAALWTLRWPILTLLAIFIIGTTAFRLGGHSPNVARALVYTLNLVSFQLQPGDVPDDPALQVLAFILMIAGVLALAGGGARFFQYVMDPKQQQLALVANLKNHVVVCGVGRVGFRVIEELLSFGESVVAVNSDAHAELLDSLRARNVPILVADARRRATLEDAGVARAQSIVCCTSDELTNLDIALDARDLKPDIKVVLRMFDRAFAAKVAKGFNIKTALSVSALAAPAFAAAATRVNIDHSFRVRDQALNVRTVTARAGGQLANRSVRDLQRALNVSIVMRNDVLHPAEDDVIMTDDTVTCVGALDAIDRLNAAA